VASPFGLAAFQGGADRGLVPTATHGNRCAMRARSALGE
jgi:hypothetical protein